MPKAKKRQAPPVGSQFPKTYKNVKYTLTVIKSDGGVAYKLGRAVFSAPSAAAKSITGSEVNGWRFWRIA